MSRRDQARERYVELECQRASRFIGRCKPVGPFLTDEEMIAIGLEPHGHGTYVLCTPESMRSYYRLLLKLLVLQIALAEHDRASVARRQALTDRVVELTPKDAPLPEEVTEWPCERKRRLEKARAMDVEIAESRRSLQEVRDYYGIPPGPWDPMVLCSSLALWSGRRAA